MKRTLVLGIIFALLCSCYCFATEYDFANMTRDELISVRNEVDSMLSENHEPSGTDKSKTETAIKQYVETKYGKKNVDWAWIDYTYTKDWDYITMSTHADIDQGNGDERFNVYGEVYKAGSNYEVIYLMIEDEVILDARDKITDERVRVMLGLGSTDETVADKPVADIEAALADEAEDDENESESVAEESEPVVAKRGDRNDTVKEIQELLIRCGYLSGKADGDFGGKTETAVKNFQKANGMEETGIVTESVYEGIINEAKSIPEPVVYPSYTAKQVYSKYESNEIAADGEFKGKVIEVTGKVDSVGKTWGTPYVYLRADSYGFKRLYFSFKSSDESQLASLSEGQTVTIRGECDGYSLITVQFDDCTLVG